MTLFTRKQTIDHVYSVKYLNFIKLYGSVDFQFHQSLQIDSIFKRHLASDNDNKT